MRRPSLPLLLAPFLLAGTLLTAATPVLAQGIGRNAPPPSAGPASRPPPPALPGLAARRAPEPIPAETPATSLSPNAALFDAITRGDLPAAREAMARGADLNARNQLGLSPIDAAVDQGRNEIAFYLLSARGSVGGGPTIEPAEPAPPPTARRGRGGREVPAARAPALDEEAPPARATGLLSDPPRRGAPAAPVALRARLFAGDGGSPRPEVGFLGFDAGRPDGAEPLPEGVQRQSAGGARHRAARGRH
ncbi:ankyrin repeat domain-containing protein [Roseomonas sp. KE2513]|uniref:ankyrin repeat domain-containing protein n=1 Tax=Roseomonas sp. KE2513 TaxID=2479202 RepID=UPI0018DF95B2|nr:ankyrin repeat domain-containing protein [Roseomonas sp. KE2513]MBI0535833.1 ankyrin repeat domain-containing protein [Roseomonas sp. KE2513]